MQPHRGSLKGGGKDLEPGNVGLDWAFSIQAGRSTTYSRMLDEEYVTRRASPTVPKLDRSMFYGT